MKRRRQKATVHYAKDQSGKFIRIPIREVRPGYYMVDYRREGKTERKAFSDLVRAENHARSLAVDKRNRGLMAFDLTNDQRHDALKGLELLAGSATLEQACREYIRRHPVKGGETLVSTAAKYIRLMRKEGARRVSIKDKLWKFRNFIKGVGADTITAGVDKSTIESWMTSAGYTSHHTRKDYMGAIQALLNLHHGVRRTRAKRDEVLPAIWKPRQVENLMNVAAVETPEAVPALAILFWAGLRPHELFRLDWKNIRLADGYIVVDPETSKLRAARTVDISSNLVKWLAPRQKDAGLVCGGQFVFRRLREKVMKKAEIRIWPVDVSRHTYATAYFVEHGDAGRVMQQLGHFGSVGTFTRHYKALMTKAEASAYWAIEPKQGKILRLRASA